MTICKECGDSIGSRYHEVAHQPDVETVSREELVTAMVMLAKLDEVPDCDGCGRPCYGGYCDWCRLHKYL